MSRIDGYEIPESIIRTYLEVLKTAPPRVVIDYARGWNKDLLKGFRASVSNAETVRKRIENVLKGGGDIDSGLRELLAGCGLNRELVAVLSVQVLEAFVDQLAAVFDRDLFLGAMLVDEREDVRRIAALVLEGDSGLPDRKAAEDDLRTGLTPFIAHFGRLADGSGGTVLEEQLEDAVTRAREETAAAYDGKLKKLQQQEKQAEKKIRQLKKALDQEKKKERQIDKSRESMEQRCEALRDELAAKSAKLKALEEEVDGRVQQGVDREMSSIVRQWISEPVSIEEEVSRGSDVLERADKVLAAQVSRDKHSGTRGKLLERLEQLREKRDKLQEVRAESLNVLPDLLAVSREIDDEIGRLAGLVGRDDSEFAFPQELAARINESADVETLEKYHGVLEELEDLGFVPASVLRRLYHVYHKKAMRMYDEYAPVVIRPPAPRDPAMRLRRAIHDNSDLVCLLDGHNVLFCLEGFFSRYYEKDIPRQAAREVLEETMIAMAGDASNCRIEIHYDGPVASEKLLRPNIKVVFSGGEEGTEHRADDVILAHLEFFCRSASAMPRVLVTNDRSLADRAREMDTEIMKLLQFAALLEGYLPRA
jgi:hypothetical protein